MSLRSVDRACVGRVSSPVIRIELGADGFPESEGSTSTPCSWVWRPNGVGDQGMRTGGLPRNLGGTTVPSSNEPVRAPVEQGPGPREFGPVPVGANTGTQERYQRARETEPLGYAVVVRAPHSTDEGGEPVPRGPAGGKGVSGSRLLTDVGSVMDRRRER